MTDEIKDRTIANARERALGKEAVGPTYIPFGTESRLLGGPKLFAAFSKFQGAVGKIGRASQGQIGHQQYKYAPLEVVVEAIKKPMADNGLSYTQMLSENKVSTFLFHESGEILENVNIFPEWAMEDSSDRGEPMQRAGIKHTYMRRYALLSLIGQSPDDEDSDGANKKATTVSKEKKAAEKLRKDLMGCTTEDELVALWDASEPILAGIKKVSPDKAYRALNKVYNDQLNNLRLPEDTVEDIGRDEEVGD